MCSATYCAIEAAAALESRGPFGHADLSDQFFDDFAVNVGEAEVASLETVSQLGMIEAEQVQDRGVQVMDVDFVCSRMKSKLV